MNGVISFVISVLVCSIFQFFTTCVFNRRKIKIKTLYTHKGRKTPFYQGTDGAVCLDCFARASYTIPKGGRCLIPLGFACELPHNTELQVRPRSGLSKNGIDICLGTVDMDYRGEVSANVVNNSESDFYVEKDMRICQIAFSHVPCVQLVYVDELSETKRGTGGFGSSGLK